MSILIAILPIVIIIALPVIIMRLRMKFITVKITHWLLIIYIGLLLLSMAIVPFIAADETIGSENVKEIEIEQVRNDLHESLSTGKIAQIESKYLIRNKNFDYELPKLTIVSNSEKETIVYVERKKSDDGKIEAYVYSSGLIIDGIDFTKQLIPINFGLKEETLTIYHPVQQEMKISMVKKEFTINQFIDRKESTDRLIGHGEQAIYLRIPKNLKLSRDQINLFYVGK